MLTTNRAKSTNTRNSTTGQLFHYGNKLETTMVRGKFKVHGNMWIGDSIGMHLCQTLQEVTTVDITQLGMLEKGQFSASKADISTDI